MANTSCRIQLQNDYPMTLLDCFCHSTGLPDEQMGNAEVEPMHTGTGRLLL